MRITKDFMRLATTITWVEYNRIKSKYPANRRNNLYFHYSRFTRKPNYFSLLMIPKNLYCNSYNTILTFNPSNPPLEAIEVFHMIDPERWEILRIDIAFDFASNYKDVFLLPPPTSAKISNYNGTFYYGAVNSECTVCQYDKQKQLQEVYKMSSLPMTRIEFRLRPNKRRKKEEQEPRTMLDFSASHFRKMKLYHFVPDTRNLRGYRWELKKLNKDMRSWKDLTWRKRAEIRELITDHYSDMYTLFMNAIEGDITGFLLEGLQLQSITQNETAQNYGVEL